MLDSMCRQMSTKAGCRRWPLAVFYNILDLAGVNSWIIYRKQTGSRISRRKFLHQLSEELVGVASEDDTSEPGHVARSSKLAKRVTCQIKTSCKRNSTSTTCIMCKRPVCGMCLANMCSLCHAGSSEQAS